MAIIDDQIYIMRDTNSKITKLYNRLCYDTKTISFQDVIEELKDIMDTCREERIEIKKECDSDEKIINKLEDENLKLFQKVKDLEFIKESYERALGCEKIEV